MLDLARKDPRAYHCPASSSAAALTRCRGCSGISPASAITPTRPSQPATAPISCSSPSTRVAEAESHLDANYFRETVHLRSAQGALNLYFRASRFKNEFPGRQPEFRRQKPPRHHPKPPPLPMPMQPIRVLCPAATGDMTRRRRLPPAPEPMEDAAAIARLEAEVIPWQSGRDGAPARRLREEPTAHPLVAAEGLLRRSARAGAPGAWRKTRRGKFAGCHGIVAGRATVRQSPPPERRADDAEEWARQSQQLLRWAARHGRLIDRRLEDRLVNLGGVEHEVFLDDATGRWIKLTLPGKAGKELRAIGPGGIGVRPTLVDRGRAARRVPAPAGAGEHATG